MQLGPRGMQTERGSVWEYVFFLHIQLTGKEDSKTVPVLLLCFNDDGHKVDRKDVYYY